MVGQKARRVSHDDRQHRERLYVAGGAVERPLGRDRRSPHNIVTFRSSSRCAGSEEPCREFDVEFLPYKLHNLDHWLDIAFAKLIGINIPPIELIRVPSGYFAQSGHYRISVLRVMGHKVIQAYVTSWEIF